MKNQFVVFAIVVVLGFVSAADAQRGQRNGQGANQNGNQDVDQNMPTVEQIAQMMLANFDTDGSGELGQSELQSALMALRQEMQNRNNSQNQTGQNQAGQDQSDQQQNGFANQRQTMQAGQTSQGVQQQGNRSGLQRGQGNGRRGR